MVMKSRGSMTEKLTPLKIWYNLWVKQPSRVPCSSMIFPSVSFLFENGKVRRSFIPVRYIPEWLPWLSYKPLARYGYDIGQVVLHVPMEFARESIVSMWAFRDVLKLNS